jgi:hypothetical protein
MRFRISRASHFNTHNTPPCEGAIKDKNHWYIEISTLEELLEFIEKLDEGIIFYNKDSITIYDDYVE